MSELEHQERPPLPPPKYEPLTYETVTDTQKSHTTTAPEQKEEEQEKSRLTPEQAREAFETTYSTSLVEERKLQAEHDTPEHALAVYELQVDMSTSKARRTQISNFLLSAAEAGYTQFSAPLVIPTARATSVYFLLEKLPLPPTAPPQTEQSSGWHINPLGSSSIRHTKP